KYEEGPGFTLLTKKARLSGKWDLKSSTNGSVTIEDSSDDLVEYTKDNTVIYSGGGLSINGTWEFTDDKTGVLETVTFLGQPSTDTTHIIRLTNSELWKKEGNTIYKFEKK
ncbi:MAG: hypothetical protein ACK479_01105, partial [Fluviicola sp.]